MNFPKFNKIARLSRDITITEKIDGCFDYKSRVLTDKGYECIGKIVNQKLDRKVLTYNFEEKYFEYVPILNHFKKKATYKDFLAIKLQGYKRGTAYYRFRCTHNHRILTKDGYKRADELTLEDKLLSPNNPLTYIQKQMILGTLLGDATVRCPNKVSLGYGHAQTIKRQSYSDLIAKLLGRFYCSSRTLKGGYANTDIIHTESNFDYQLQDYLKTFIKTNKKHFTSMCLKELSSISLAFWYMDDGSVSFNNAQLPRITLHTQGFDKTQVHLLLQALREKFNFNPTFTDYGKGWQIGLNTIDSQKLFILVAPYLIETMKYKLPIELRNTSCFWDTYHDDLSKFHEQTILEIKQNTDTGSDYHYKYDLETANHNYIVSGVVVHNSNALVYIAKYNDIIEHYETSIDSKIEAIQWIEHYCLGKLGELCIFAGSRKRWLAIGEDNFGFANWVEQNASELFKLEEGHHYGEWFGKGIQRKYDLDNKRFALFNVAKWNIENKPDCCEVVPVLYKGEFDTQSIECVLDNLKITGSIMIPNFMNPEGIVIYHKASNQMFKKTIENDAKPKGLNES